MFYKNYLEIAIHGGKKKQIKIKIIYIYIYREFLNYIIINYSIKRNCNF